MTGTVEMVHADDGDEVAANARDVGAHAVEQVAELLDVRLAGGVVDGGGAGGHDGGHDDVGRTRDRSLVEEHVGALQPFGLDVVDVLLIVVDELGAKVLEAEEMGVEAPPPYLVAAGLGNGCLAETAEQRPNHQHRTAQRRAFLDEVAAVEVVEVDVVGLEGVVVGRVLGDLHADVLQQPDEVVDVEDIGDVGDAHGVAGEQRGADHLQGLVLGALRCDGAFQRVSALNDE